jgi:hypothetical protein
MEIIFDVPMLSVGDAHEVLYGMSHGISSWDEAKNMEGVTTICSQEQIESKSAAVSKICADVDRDGVSKKSKCKLSLFASDVHGMFDEMPHLNVVWDEMTATLDKTTSCKALTFQFPDHQQTTHNHLHSCSTVEVQGFQLLVGFS